MSLDTHLFTFGQMFSAAEWITSKQSVERGTKWVLSHLARAVTHLGANQVFSPIAASVVGSRYPVTIEKGSGG